ncbi:MAG: hypothetical protein RLZZ09_473 [Pseudomonadota bacterium]|jgi:hypothetical protein
MGRSSGSTGGSSESGNYNRMSTSLNGTTPNQTRGQTSNSTGSSLGLTTGSTWYGNTAFGPAGGMATGYATKAPGGRVDSGSSSFGNPAAGGGFGQGAFSNFRNPAGSAMFGSGPGAPGGAGVTARNAIEALMMARALQQRVRPAAGPAMRQPGLLDPELPENAVPEIPSIPPNMPVDNAYGYHFMRNPTQRPYDVRNSPPRAYFSGTYPTGKSDYGGSPFGKRDYGGRPFGKRDFRDF